MNSINLRFKTKLILLFIMMTIKISLTERDDEKIRKNKDLKDIQKII